LNLSGSRSCHLDHFIADGSEQVITPFTPKGARFVEVHVRDVKAKIIDATFLERTYYPDPKGSFQSNDALLNRIWSVGVETVRACSEDALVDCPTRERGQWTGDVASVATRIAAYAFGDIKLSRRALVQAAQAARTDGLVAGLGPSEPGYLSTYAAQWVLACTKYVELTGDRTLWVELEEAARKNLSAFQAKWSEQGLSDDLGWGFVDWGYVRNSGKSDMALNLHYLGALEAFVQWLEGLGKDASEYRRQAKQVRTLVQNWTTNELKRPTSWNGISYQVASLALLYDVVPKTEIRPCIARIKQHLLECFPNNPNGPRLSDPGISDPRLMTPYFCHFSFTALLKHCEVDFVLGQYRKCWGWALEDDRTTWLEVFDLRWSHCHEWSGCPTWQLSEYVLGVRPRFDLGKNHFEVDPMPGDLNKVTGKIPLMEGGFAEVGWERGITGLVFKLSSPQVVKLKIQGKWIETKSGEFRIQS
jgi:hypothetical protein